MAIFRGQPKSRKPECRDCDQTVPEIEIKAYAGPQGFKGQILNGCGECGTTYSSDRRTKKKARGAAG